MTTSVLFSLLSGQWFSLRPLVPNHWPLPLSWLVHGNTHHDSFRNNSSHTMYIVDLSHKCSKCSCSSWVASTNMVYFPLKIERCSQSSVSRMHIIITWYSVDWTLLGINFLTDVFCYLSLCQTWSVKIITAGVTDMCQRITMIILINCLREFW